MERLEASLEGMICVARGVVLKHNDQVFGGNWDVLIRSRCERTVVKYMTSFGNCRQEDGVELKRLAGF